MESIKKPFTFELKRQLFHAFFGILFVVLFYFDLITAWFMLWLIVLGLIWSFMFRHQDIPGLDWILEHFERPDLKFKGMGAITHLIGVFVPFLIFEKSIALAAVMALSLGDAASTLAGKYWAKTRLPWSSKSWKGSITGWLFAFLGMLVFVPVVPALIASLLAMFVESFDLNKIQLDDNIVVPIVAGLVLFFLGIWF